jgi:hypothetical protein
MLHIVMWRSNIGMYEPSMGGSPGSPGAINRCVEPRFPDGAGGEHPAGDRTLPGARTPRTQISIEPNTAAATEQNDGPLRFVDPARRRSRIGHLGIPGLGAAVLPLVSIMRRDLRIIWSPRYARAHPVKSSRANEPGRSLCRGRSLVRARRAGLIARGRVGRFARSQKPMSGS